MKRIQTTSGKSSRPAPWSWLRPAGAAALLLTVPAHAASFVYHTATGYQATSDLDANGVNDILLVDRATGLYRVGYISPVGAVTWAAARPSGMTDITGMAVGRLSGAAQ